MSNHAITLHQCPICYSEELKPFLKTRDFSISKETFELHQCIACGFVFTQYMPGPEDIGKYYSSEDYISHSDTAKGLINKLYHIGRQWMLNYKLGIIRKTSSGKKILDYGAGTGYFLDHMKQKGYKVRGVEQDDHARIFALKKFGIQLLTPEDFLDTKETNFDVISLWHVLEHLHHLNEFMQMIRSRLSENGRLVIAVPNRLSLDALYYGKYWAAYDVPRHLWHFDPANLIQLAEKHGFLLEKIKILPLDPFYNALLSEKYKENRLGFLSAGIQGLRSWLAGLFNKRKASSPVYIFKYKK